MLAFTPVLQVSLHGVSKFPLLGHSSSPNIFIWKHYSFLMDSLRSQEVLASENDILSELEACEDRIAQLELQLSMEYELRDTILQGIENEGLTIITIPAISFPNEILLHIFEKLVEEDSLAIFSVLLVCQKWHQLAMIQESLWSRLSFRVPKTRALKYLRASQRYTDLALLRSGERLLDITIDFRNIKDLDTVTFEEATVGLPRNVLTYWSTGWRLHCNSNSQDSCVFSEITRTLLGNLICSLMGAGTTAHRWRTLTFKTASHLSYSSSDRQYDMSEYMFSGYDALALERVDLLDYNVQHMASIPTTKHLLIHSKFLSSRAKTHFRALEHLHMRVDSFFPSLKPSTMLRSLSVDFIQDAKLEDVPRASLESLETLSIRGPSAHALLDRLEMPRLRVLRLIGKNSIQSTSRLVGHSQLRSLHILAAKSDAPTIRAFLKARATEIRRIQGIVVMPWHLEIVAEWIGSLSGKRPGDVQTVEWIIRTMNEGDLEEELWREEIESRRYQKHHIT